MDPNDKDTTHYAAVFWMVLGDTWCGMDPAGRKTTMKWDDVDCRVCVLSRDIRAAR